MTQNIEQAGQSAAEVIDPDPSAPEDYEVGLKSLNQWQLAWRKFRKHHLALIGLAIIGVLILDAVIGPVLLPFSFTDIPTPTQVVGTGRPPFCETFDFAAKNCTSWLLTHPMGET